MFKTTQVNTATLKTRLVITNDNSLIVGDDDAFTIERSARISDGDGQALTIGGQNGKASIRMVVILFFESGPGPEMALKGNLRWLRKQTPQF